MRACTCTARCSRGHAAIFFQGSRVGNINGTAETTDMLDRKKLGNRLSWKFQIGPRRECSSRVVE